MFNQSQKALFAEKFMDLANLMLATLVIGQAVAEKINWLALTVGVVIYILICVFAYIIEKGME